MKKVYYQLTLILAILVMTGVFNIFPAKGETLLTSIKYNDVPAIASDSNASKQRDIDKSENTLIDVYKRQHYAIGVKCIFLSIDCLNFGSN